MLAEIKNSIITNAKRYGYFILMGLVTLCCVIISGIAVKSCVNANKINNHNIIALTDTIEYYKGKNNKLVASKTILEGDLSTLKIANEKLYKQLKDMKVSDPSSVVYVNTVVENIKRDTCWIINENDSIISKEFSFVDEYRQLEGNVNYTDTALSLNITNDKVFVDYTLAIENGKVLLQSNNPYVKYKEITGLTIPNNRKKWSIGIGPQIGYGYDFVAKKLNPYIGIGINFQYNLLQW